MLIKLEVPYLLNYDNDQFRAILIFRRNNQERNGQMKSDPTNRWPEKQILEEGMLVVYHNEKV